MNIVILDAYTANPGDLSWAPVAALGQLTVHDRTAKKDVLARCQGMEAVLCNKAVLDAQTINQLPNLKYIGIIATGCNTVDLQAARARDIPVCNAPGYGATSVAQHVFALILELTNQVGLHAASTAAGEWSAQPDWTFQKAPMLELNGKTLGIIGLGQIGSQVARIGQALGMRILGVSRSPKQIPGVTFTTLDPLFAESDIVSLNCPLTDENRGFVDADRIAQMKPGAFLINTARGPLIDENALAIALRTGQIAGAGLDVLSAEPPPATHPLLHAPNCLVTPHNAWGTRESRKRLIGMVANNLQFFQQGKPINVIN